MAHHRMAAGTDVFARQEPCVLVGFPSPQKPSAMTVLSYDILNDFHGKISPYFTVAVGHPFFTGKISVQ